MKEETVIKEIHRYISGDLSLKEIDELWVQFLKNPEYYNWFETELHLRKLAKDSKKATIHPLNSSQNNSQKTFRNYRKWVIAAAAAVVISFGLQFFSMDGTDTILNYSIESIENTELVGADVFRSDEEEGSSIDVAINQGLAYAYNDEEERAIETFREILLQDPTEEQRARAEINLGILLYNQGDYSDAVIHFETVTQIDELNRFFEEKAWWFLGNAYLNLRQLSEARDAVFNAYTLDGRYQTPALTLLKKLDVELEIVPTETEEP